MKRVLLLCSAVISLTACGNDPKGVVAQASPSGGDTSAADCAGPVKQEATSVGNVDAVTSYSTTAGDVAAWHESRYTGDAAGRKDQVWRAYDPSTPVSLCVYDGKFSFPGPPGPSPNGRDGSATRSTLFRVNGQVLWGDYGDPASRSDWAPPGAVRTS